MHSLDDIAEAITQKTILLLATAEPGTRQQVLQERLQQLGGMCELARWLERWPLERKLEAQINTLKRQLAEP